MPKLEKLPYLGCLVLNRYSYAGKSMMCTAGGFPRLELLFIVQLHALEEWKVEGNTMPKLNLGIVDCRKLNRLPELQHVTNLQTLEMDEMPKEFWDKLQNDTGEDW